MFQFVVFCLIFSYGLGAIPYKLVHDEVDLEGLPYIIDGEDAEDGKYPYQVSLHIRIGSKKEHFCGASILTKNWIMTAGHCCAASAYDALVGTNSLSRGGKTYRTTNYKIHPKYDPKKNWSNDICLIQTIMPIEFSSTVQPVTLPSQGAELKDGEFLTVTGWGYTKPNNKVIPDRLQVGKNFKYVSLEKCAALTNITSFGGFGSQPSLWIGQKQPPHEDFENYIINGEEAPDGAYPYMLSLNFRKKDFHACGASVLTKNWALTAAHCCSTGYEMYLYSGSNSLSKGGSKHEIESYNVHPKYAPLDVWKNDICLIKVKDPFVLGPKVKQITLPPQNWPLKENDEVLITGWGYTNNDEQKVPDKLHRANFTVLSPQKCESMTGRAHESYLCVKQTTRGQGACNGDSGGPLVKKGVQVGVASFVYQPCGFGLPDFYSRVPIFINWIKETLGSEASELKFIA